MVGAVGSGKSTFVGEHLKDYTRVNRDSLKTKEKCLKVAEEAMKKKEYVVIDNQNTKKQDREEFIALAKKYSTHPHIPISTRVQCEGLLPRGHQGALHAQRRPERVQPQPPALLQEGRLHPHPHLLQVLRNAHRNLPPHSLSPRNKKASMKSRPCPSSLAPSATHRTKNPSTASSKARSDFNYNIIMAFWVFNIRHDKLLDFCPD